MGLLTLGIVATFLFGAKDGFFGLDVVGNAVGEDEVGETEGLTVGVEVVGESVGCLVGDMVNDGERVGAWVGGQSDDCRPTA